MGRGKDSLYYFDVDNLEVWGVGGEDWIKESLEAQQKERELAQANLMRARKVDKKQFVDDLRSGLLSGSHKAGMFGHLQHTSGRCDL